MGLRFFRRVRVMPGVTLNFSMGGVSVSVGPPGAQLTMGTSGTRATVGLPGTGLYYTTKLGTGHPTARSGTSQHDRLLEACAAADADDMGRALEVAGRIRHVDAAFLCGALIVARDGDPAEAERHLRRALKGADRLGTAFAAIGTEPQVCVPIDDQTSAVLAPDRLGASLALVEALQRQGKSVAALRLARQFAVEHPANQLVAASVADLESEAG